MAQTLSDVLTSLAYRLGEDSSPTETSEKARRVRFINEGYRKVFLKQPFWFTEKTATMNSQASVEEYDSTDGFPSDYRDMIELRVDDYVYTPIPESQVFGMYDKTSQVFNYDNLVTAKHFYVFADVLHVLPATPSAGTNNITLKYYYYPASVTTDAGTFVIPDTFIDCLSAYAYGRISQLDGDRAGASDGFGEFDEIVKDMVYEQNRRNFFNKSARPVHPSYLTE